MNENREAYNEALNTHGHSSKALRWNNYNSAASRYKELTNNLDFHNKSVLDIGCGMGDIIPFIYASSPNFKYTGIDASEEFINIAKKRYEGYNFIAGDPFGGDLLGEKFDIVLASGILNSTDDDWLNQRKIKISKMFDMANEALAFNMAGSLDNLESTELITYADVGTISNYCISITRKVIVKTHYHKKDFTVIMFR